MTRSDEQFAIDLNALLDRLLASFDQLRERLGDDLGTYEGSLTDALLELPEWLALDPNDLKALYLIDDTLIGPRSVATVALDVEVFVGEWVGDYDAAVRLDFDPALVEDYRAHCAQIERTLESQENAARICASQIASTLGEWLEQILDELQAERDEDEHALADLVTEGSLDKGREQLRENADVWEDYRKRAEALTDAWDRLEQLAFEGVDRTVNGLESLRKIVETADRGLTDLYHALQLDLAPLVVPDRIEDEERATLELDREPDESSIAEETDDEERRTVELQRVQATIEKARPNSEPDDNDDGNDDDSDATEDEVSEAEQSEPVDEVFWGTRTATSRRAVPTPEVALVWGLPAVFFGVVIIAAIAHTMGQDGAQNPFERFGWLWPICVIAGIEMIAVPMIRGWRVSDPGDGRRPNLVRFEDEEESIEITLFEDAVKVGGTTLHTADVTLRRWEQYQPAEIGWSLAFDSGSVVCRETNVTRWEDSSCDSKPLPSDAWSVSVERFWQIGDALNVSR